MRLETGRGMLQDALEALQARWDATMPHWQDAVQTQFVKEVWEPLQEQVHAALDAIDQLQAALNQMRQECAGAEYDIQE